MGHLGWAMLGSLLLVDDNALLVENLREILTAAGHGVCSAGSVAATLMEPLMPFEVALVDVRLPDGNGNELAVRLRQARPECEVILLTADASIETAAAAVRSGAYAYLVKPCTVPELLLTVQQALRHARLRSEKVELARRAQMAERLAAVGTLTAGLSHEIRNPLNAAGLQLAVLERRVHNLPGEAQVTLLEPLGLVRDEIQRLNRIVVDFLQFARPRELNLGDVSLTRLLVEVLAFLAETLDRRQLQIERVLPPDAPHVCGDSDALRQMFLNLLLNASEAAPEGGRLRVSVCPREGELQVDIEDDGPGVDPALRERIFEPFFTTKPAGSGLGLPIVHALVVQHGGRLVVSASSLGGALFSLRLPLVP